MPQMDTSNNDDVFIRDLRDLVREVARGYVETELMRAVQRRLNWFLLLAFIGGPILTGATLALVHWALR